MRPMNVVSTSILAAGVLIAPDATFATTITTIVTGTVTSGMDTGIFHVGPSLTGQKFTLIYSFDDTQGTLAVTNCATGVPCASQFTTTSLTSKDVAVLQIGNISWTFGALPGHDVNFAQAYRQVAPRGSNVRYYFHDSNGTTHDSEFINGEIDPLNGTALTNDYLWDDSFPLDSKLSPTSGPGFLIATHVGGIKQTATGQLHAQSISVMGLSSHLALAELPSQAAAAGGPPVMMARLVRTAFCASRSTGHGQWVAPMAARIREAAF